MHTFRPFIRGIPHKSVSSLYTGQSNAGASSLFPTLTSNQSYSSHTFTSTNLNHAYNHFNGTYASRSDFNQKFRFASLADNFNIRYDSTPSLSPFTKPSSPPLEPLFLDNMSEEEFIQLRKSIRSKVSLAVTVTDVHNIRAQFPKVIAKNKERIRLYFESIICSLTELGIVNFTDEYAQEIQAEYSISHTPFTYYNMIYMFTRLNNWNLLFKWLDYCQEQHIVLDYPWDDIMSILLKEDSQKIRGLKLFKDLNSLGLHTFSFNTLILLANTCAKEKDIEAIKFLIPSLIPYKDSVPLNVTSAILEANLEISGWDNGLTSLGHVFQRNSGYSKRFKSEVIKFFAQNAQNFNQFYSIYLFSQRYDIHESFLDSLVYSYTKWHRDIRLNLNEYKEKLDLTYYQFFLRKLIRYKLDPTFVIETLNEMKDLGLKGSEELKTIIDLFQLNLSLNFNLSTAEKEDYKTKVAELLPNVTTNSLGVSFEDSLETQAINHRILQSQDPFFCSSEIYRMISNSLRPSSVAITHTLARFMHCRKYEDGLKLFRHCLPSLNSLAKETDFVSACGPVYNFAIRFCCRTSNILEARALVSELESNGGYLDPFASAELIMLLKSINGPKSAIEGGLYLFDILKKKKVQIPAYFFNVLFNTMIDAGHINSVWSLLDKIEDVAFSPTAITYGVLIKAALRDNDFSKALGFLQKSIDTKVLFSGPSMPIYCQLLEYALDHKDKYSGISLIEQVEKLGLKTNPRFDLLVLRLYSEAEPLTFDILVTTLKKQNNVGHIPIHNFKAVLTNCMRAHEYAITFEVMKIMHSNGFIPEREVYNFVVSGLRKNNDLALADEVESLFVKFYRTSEESI